MEEFKICTKCKTRLALACFAKRARYRNGLNSWCKLCCRAYDVAYQKNNAEKRRLSHANHYRTNAEKIRRRQRVWSAANREKESQRQRAWQAANREKIRRTQRAWQAANREKIRRTRQAWRKINRLKHREYALKQQLSLSDGYVANTLRMPVKKVGPNLLEAKREHLKMYRITKQLIAIIKEKHNDHQ